MWRARLLLALLSLGVVMLVAEFGLRMAADRRAQTFVGAAVPTDDTIADPLLVAWWKPNYRAPDGEPTFDNLGFRTNGSTREGPGQRPVVMLGGSTAYSWGSSNAETIEAQLEQILPDDRLVLNGGYPGLTSLDTLLVYHARVASLHPSVVVLLAGLNDVYYAVDWIPDNRLNWLSRVYETGLRARRETQLRPLVDAIDRIALRQCFTCYAVSAGFSQLYERTKFVPVLRAGQVFGLAPVGSSNPRAMELTAFAIGELARRVRDDGGCLVVAWQPIAGVNGPARSPHEQEAIEQISDRAPTWPIEAPRMWAELMRATRPLFASGVAVEADLTRVFDSVEAITYVDDGVHYSPLANRLLAEAIAPVVARGC